MSHEHDEVPLGGPLKSKAPRNPLEYVVESIIFGGRWLQAPMYLGLILGSVVYEYKFMVELYHLVHEAGTLTEEAVMLGVLTLVDMIMVANLIFMVVLGGYAIFVSHIDLDEHPDRPEWLDKTNAASLKIKLASSLVGVSGVHLLKAFINLEQLHDYTVVKWQVVIHVTFLFSSIMLALSERILYGQSKH